MADGRIVIDAILNKTGLEKGLAGLQRSMGNAAQKAKHVGSLMTKYITLPLLALGAAAFAAANDLDKAYKNIRAGTGATGDALEDLKGSFKSVFRTVPQGAEEVSTVIADLNTLTGATGDSLEKMGKSALDASRMLGEDSAGLVNSAAHALNNWNIEAEQGPKYMDMMFKASQSTGISMSKLGDQLARHGPTLRELGFSFEESAALLSQFEKSGIDANGIIRSMRSNLHKLAKDGQSPAEAFEELQEKMMNATSTTEAAEIAYEVFGSRATEVADAVRNGTFNVSDFAKELINAEGIIEETGQETLSFGEKLAKLKNKAQIGLEPLGRVLLDLAERWLPPVMDAVEKVANWFENLNPHMQTAIVIIGIIVALLGPLIMFMGMVGTVLAGVSVAMIKVIAIVGLVIGVLVALGYIFYKLWTENEAFRDAVLAIWEKIKEFGIYIWEILKEALADIWDSIKQTAEVVFGWLQAFWDEWGADILAVLEFYWNTIKTVVETVIENVKDLIGLVMAIIRGDWDEAWERIKSILSRTWEAINDIVGDYVELVRDFIARGMERARNIISNIWERIKTIVRNRINSIRDNIRDTFNRIVESVRERIQKVKDRIKDGIQDALNFIRNLGSSFRDAGKGLVDQIVDGIKSMASKPVDAIKDVTNRVRRFLPFSPAKEGPLSDLDKLDFAGPMVDSLKKGLPSVEATLGAMLHIPEATITAPSNTESQNNVVEHPGYINNVIMLPDGRVLAELVSEAQYHDKTYGGRGIGLSP